MTKLDEAVKKAIEVLDDVQGNINPERGFAQEMEKDVEDALTALRAATAAPGAEPEKTDQGSIDRHYGAPDWNPEGAVRALLAASPCAAPAAPSAFEHWLDTQRGLRVSEVFHEIVLRASPAPAPQPAGMTQDDLPYVQQALGMYVSELKKHKSWLKDKEGTTLPGAEIAITEIEKEIVIYTRVLTAALRASSEPGEPT